MGFEYLLILGFVALMLSVHGGGAPRQLIEIAQMVVEAHPAVSLRIVGGYAGHLVEWVQRGSIDATVLYGPAPDFQLPVRPLFTEALVAVACPGSL